MPGGVRLGRKLLAKFTTVGVVLTKTVVLILQSLVSVGSKKSCGDSGRGGYVDR